MYCTHDAEKCSWVIGLKYAAFFLRQRYTQPLQGKISRLVEEVQGPWNAFMSLRSELRTTAGKSYVFGHCENEENEVLQLSAEAIVDNAL
jgi:hypothetical protein